MDLNRDSSRLFCILGQAPIQYCVLIDPEKLKQAGLRAKGQLILPLSSLFLSLGFVCQEKRITFKDFGETRF
jgi:hypothetical protein